jgi:hypothetical protein
LPRGGWRGKAAGQGGRFWANGLCARAAFESAYIPDAVALRRRRCGKIFYRGNTLSSAFGKKGRTYFLRKRSNKLLYLARTLPQSAHKDTKVFWFFFSKKNIPSFLFLRPLNVFLARERLL